MNKGIPAILIAAVIGACAQPARFVYPPARDQVGHVSEKPKYRLRVAVLPFEEMRGDGSSTATFWVCFLPLAPFGFVAHERPDRARFFNTVSAFDFKADRDLAKAVATSLGASGLFSHVYFAAEGEKGNADLIVSGRVQRTRYLGRTYTYCLSVAGAALWVLGLPVGDSTDELAFSLEVKDAGNGSPIWGCRSESSKRVVQGLYYRWGDDVEGYSELMEGAMHQVVRKLDRALAAYQKERGGRHPGVSLDGPGGYGPPHGAGGSE